LIEVGAFSGELYIDDVGWETQDNYTLSLPNDGNLTLVVASMVGHPDDGCPGSGAGTCNQGQDNEEFNILVDGNPLAFVPDHGEDQWALFSFDFGAFVMGEHGITFAHTLNPGNNGLGSVGYRAVACLTPPVVSPVALPETITPAPLLPPEATPTPEPTPVPTEETRETPPPTAVTPVVPSPTPTKEGA